MVVEGSDRLFVRVDALHMRSAIENLIRNALRYSTPGTKVRVVVELREGSRRSRWTTKGRGISAKDRETIFDPMAVGENGSGHGSGPLRRQPRGRATRWHHPMQRGRSGPRDVRAPTTAIGRHRCRGRVMSPTRRRAPSPMMRVLVVDDHKLFAEAVQLALEKHGMDVVVATTADEGLDGRGATRTRRGPPGYRPPGSERDHARRGDPGRASRREDRDRDVPRGSARPPGRGEARIPWLPHQGHEAPAARPCDPRRSGRAARRPPSARDAPPERGLGRGRSPRRPSSRRGSERCSVCSSRGRTAARSRAP